MAHNDRNRPVVVLTGFGSYGSFQDNPSAAVVRRIEDEGLNDVVSGAVLHTEVIPVVYGQVEKKVFELWEKYRPDLMIHVGAHPDPRTIKIEQRSFGRGYCLLDVECQVPCGNMCPCGVETAERPQSVLVSDFDCSEIASSVSQFFDPNCIKIEPSSDPGRYLCAYSYFISLSHDKRKSLFVHVPGFSEDITEQLVAAALKLVISECFKQLNRSQL